MTTTTREELLTLLKAILPPDPIVHHAYCGFCGDIDGHKDDCQWKRANDIAFEASIGALEFEDDDDELKEPTRPGQRVRCVHAKEGVFAMGDEFVVEYVVGGDVQFEGSGDWWPRWWFEVVDEKDGE